MIAIKDMEMPKSCADCERGNVCGYGLGYGRANDCPLIEVEREKIDKAIEEITNLSRYQDGIDTMNVGDDLMISWCKTLDILKEI